MTILVYTKFNSDNIRNNLGSSEYSYYFVLQKFLPVLREIGQVQLIENPALEVDDYYMKALEDGLQCIFLCFTAPHHSYFDLKCPTIPVFAWEYDTIPNESWDGNEKNNWVYVLKKLGAAITHSAHSVRVVENELGKDFPIISCPAPIAAQSFASTQQIWEKNPIKRYEIILKKEVIDSHNLNLGQLSSEKGMAEKIEVTHTLLQKWSHEVLEGLLPKILYKLLRQTYLFTGTFVARTLRFLRSNKAIGQNNIHNNTTTSFVSGIIYTSVLNILDGRKNYRDMVAAFCHALNDKSDATLILKTPILGSLYNFKEKVTKFLHKLPAFNCRIVVIGYYLDSHAYLTLMKASTFYVNTSYGEGQCLPLMEYMAAGVPAIAPQSTALADYVNASNSFVIKTSAVPTYWQHDKRKAIRTVHHRPDWYSLVNAFRSSYELVKNTPEAYQEMGLNAASTLQNHCSIANTKNKLEKFIQEIWKKQ